MSGELNVVNGYISGFEGIYIGRPGKSRESVLGNPFSLNEYSREESIEKYRLWLWDCLKNTDSPQYKEIERLATKYGQGENLNLVCFCKPKACHGDVVKSAIKWFYSKKQCQ